MKKLLLSILAIMLLAGCTDAPSNKPADSEPDTPGEPTDPVNPDEPTEPDDPEVPENPDDPDPDTPTANEDGKVLLDCGYYQMDLPKNETPYQLVTTLSADDSTWSKNYMYNELPDNFRFIYGNSCDDGEPGKTAQPKFYSYNEQKTTQYPGRLRFDQVNKGFQTQLFEHSGNKLEIRLGISQVNNCSDKPELGKDTFRIYYFDSNGSYLGKHSIEAETISTKTKEIKYYETSAFTSKIAYFEVRLTAMAYKGSQCYNVGMSYCNFKSWERI